ncbi:MAG: DUF763 domain-containing protein [Halobacteriales archaeon]
MARRGTATLPLHDGSAPRWLFERMVDLGGAITGVVVDEYGPDELVHRLSDPYWFQALGCTLGFDWHSSGLTTTTMGALKAALHPDRHGLAVVGGKGAAGRRTPGELRADPLGLGGGRATELVRTSRLSAKVDNACLQDSFGLYHHAMVVSETGGWCVVQQGMNDRSARRYHWLDDDLDTFVETPHSAIATQTRADRVLDLTAEASDEGRSVSVDLACEDPARLGRYLRPSQRTLADYGVGDTRRGDRDVPELAMPTHHRLREADLSERALAQLEVAHELQPREYEELVEIEGVGPATVRALALIAELVHDAESSREDPAKYAHAHGGKDGTPRPIDPDQYDRSIAFLEAAVEGAELARETRQAALHRLHDLV